MNKLSYEEAVYSAFFDELEKLGYPVDEMMKAAGFNPLKALRGLTPTGKMQAALARPEMKGLGTSLSGAPVAKIRPTGGSVFTDPTAAAVRSRMSGRLAGARTGLSQGQNVAAGKMIQATS